MFGNSRDYRGIGFILPFLLLYMLLTSGGRRSFNANAFIVWTVILIVAGFGVYQLFANIHIGWG